MPILRAFFLFLLLVGLHGPGQVRAQDQAAEDPSQPASHDTPPPAEEGVPDEAPASLEGKPLAPPADALSPYSPDALVDMPYVYPLLRMRLTPEMRQEAP